MRTGKGFTLFTSNEDLNGIIKIIKSLEDSNVLIDAITVTVKHELKKQEGGCIPTLRAHLATSLVQPVISSVGKGIMEEELEEQEEDIWIKNSSSTPPFKQYQDYQDSMAFFQESIYLE